MPAVLELVEPAFLDRKPPRRLPLFFLPNLLGEYLLERPPRSYLDPWALGAFVGTVILGMLPITIWAAVLLFAFGLFRIITPSWVLVRKAVADYKLLRRGIVVSAHIMGLRLCEEGCPKGGAYIDCVIPLSPRRSLVGSVWFPDGEEARQLAALGRVQVICLPKIPGTWRLRHIDRPGIRYTPWPVVRKFEF
jgi:hypothetical protein